MKDELWEKLITQIITDLAESDCSALYGLLDMLPDDALEKYLPEDES
jgi:Mor family transcriptional regulator